MHPARSAADSVERDGVGSDQEAVLRDRYAEPCGGHCARGPGQCDGEKHAGLSGGCCQISETMNRLRVGFALGGFVLAVLSVTLNDERLGWAAIAVLAASVIVRILMRKQDEA